MALRDEWKDTGKGLGKAFAGLGRNLVRSVETGADAVTAEPDAPKPENTVFNDGSWRETGKELGGAFVGLGRSIVRSAKVGIDKADAAVAEKKDDE